MMGDPCNDLVVDFLVDGPSQAAPRMTKSDKWKQRPCVLRYREFRDRVRLELRLAIERMDDPGPLKDVVRADILFALPMPKSWSREKQRAHFGKIHRQRPDCDNLAKGVLDAIFEEDSTIAFLSVSKYWSSNPYVSIQLFK